VKKPAHREYTKYIGKVVSYLSTIPDKDSWETLCKLTVVHFNLQKRCFFFLLNVPLPHYATLGLTNRPQFSVVYTLIDYRNEVIKCSKLKWNHEPQANGFTAKF